MTARPLPGTDCAAGIRARVADRAGRIGTDGRRPVLAVVTATDDAAAAWYVRSIASAAETAGVDCRVVDLGAQASPGEIGACLQDLSADRDVRGIVLQTPLPAGAEPAVLAGAIVPDKDVDGANPLSLGYLAAGRRAFAPATAEAVVTLLDQHDVDVAGCHVVVVGRSTVVGKPLAQLLLDRDATVSLCHSGTRDLAAIASSADIVVAAVGHAHLITAEHVGPGATVVDVGTNPTDDGGLAGDVDPAVVGKAAALTPVPGGVGPVTTALLLQHTVFGPGG
ncbi:methenyltetrahydrofolate cyclohydrolase /5,10-methylenetetrahydrofolate dehydrogenase (NADP+) [Haloactinopolyspora alba]|uniref:Bifunctional protein FolD n=1 Tax=Haloactinopolyspora alba TaxID=648780 RepID=A0A2P8E765_9ACTN|nr:bifunctional 5,10-methylenetetrahydrofolate dehydrogenase/5,10-methenyltetrahydrofolate cyclohydrolase [Haloactinopolyspora alba]PSL05278.1 methenyltetrahydrofolate cyclohydrolase /5,10-methylenetetrahydrofolate dehydrogenase (NADP+) [Haloactinopolyspora alba]